MTDTLFDIPESPSPRLKWMRDNQIRIIHNGDVSPGDEDEWGNRLSPFCATKSKPGNLVFADHVTGWGDTEDEAIVELAKKLSIPLWNEPIKAP